ncbi:MAG TPA: ECF-type sigma factor [Gemmatimonadales bacterium]|jgi:RNA polymerase sigma factor (TIGR02999 family)|nr:ECF-type sigma factor [Gemmatimonadales bacterium]
MAERREAPTEAAEEETAQALTALRRGAPESLQQIIPQVYAELRRIAHRQLAAESQGHTLSTTAVVHEAYLRLSEQTRVEWGNRAQFFGLAARVMRRVLVDYARRQRATRRGGRHRLGIPLEKLDGEVGPDALAVNIRSDELLALDEALERLAAVDLRLSQVVECRYFGGLTEAETAEVLGVSKRTVSSDWAMARGWLYRELGPEPQ